MKKEQVQEKILHPANGYLMLLLLEFPQNYPLR